MFIVSSPSGTEGLPEFNPAQGLAIDTLRRSRNNPNALKGKYSRCHQLLCLVCIKLTDQLPYLIGRNNDVNKSTSAEMQENLLSARGAGCSITCIWLCP
jgi:hypothetical protein